MKARMWIVGVLVVGLAVLLAVVVQALEAQPGVLGPQPPTPGSVRPSSGCFRVGTTVYFTTTWSDLDGYADLKWCYFLIGTSSAPSNSIYLGYNRAGNKLYLRSNNGTAWWGGYAPCSANVIQNAQGKLDCSKTKVTKQGNTVRVRWAIIFKSTYIGNKNLYLRATDMSGNNSGWKKKGTVTIQSAPCPTPTATPTATEPATGLPWGMFQHEPQHTGRSPFISAQSPNLLWIFFTPGTPGSPAIGNDGTIYLPVGMLDEDTVGYLYAINPDGTEKWHVQLGGPPSSTAPAIGPDGTIYVHCNGEASTVSIERLHAITPRWCHHLDIRVQWRSWHLHIPRPIFTGCSI